MEHTGFALFALAMKNHESLSYKNMQLIYYEE